MELLYGEHRIWMEDAAGKVLAAVDFPLVRAGLVDVVHTFVDDSLRGQGVAGKLMEALAAVLRRDHLQARLSCSYAAGWFARHDGYGDVIRQ